MIGVLLLAAGVNHLCVALTKCSRSLSELSLSRTGLGARGLARIMETLQSLPNIYATLRRLDLSFNSVKGDDIAVSVCTTAHLSSI